MPWWRSTTLGVAFLLSGAAGLAYETLWSRYLGLLLGHAAFAQVLVLSVYLGGMAVGALLGGRLAERLRTPILGYAAAEVASAALGLVFHGAYRWASDAAYGWIFPALGGGAALAFGKWALAAALVAPHAVVLGMTFPLMAAGVLRAARAGPGRSMAWLYGVNSLGGAAGVIAGGFFAIERLGLPGTLRAAAAANGAAALIAALAARGRRPERGLGLPPQPETPAGAPPAEATPDGGAGRGPGGHGGLGASLAPLLLAVAFGTAVSSFVYEIAWVRMLSLVLGSAARAFELMLSAFILGLALGALAGQHRIDGVRAPLRALGIVQALMGAAALATLPIYLASFGWTARLLAVLVESRDGYRLFGVARYAFCLAVMLPATFLAGLTLPLITRTLIDLGRRERAVGRVYAASTAGSVAGAALGALVLLPAIGLKALLMAGGALDMAIGVLLLHVHDRGAGAGWRRRWAPRTAAGLALVCAATAWLARFDEEVLSSGVFRGGGMPAPGQRAMLFYRDGRTATVAVTRDRAGGHTSISTNGKVDASLEGFWFDGSGTGAPAPPRALGGDSATQLLLPLLAIAHVSAAKQVAVIGHGSGLSAHELLASPAIERLVTVEIEPAMVEGSRAFYPRNRRVFDDPRSIIVHDDARAFFAGDRARFDLIVSEPSNAWVSGVAHLFTREHYQWMRPHLAAGGVLAQWLHLYEIDDEMVFGVLAALHQTFAAYELYLTSKHDLVILAGDRPLAAADWSVFRWPALAVDLAPLRPFPPSALEALWLASRTTLGPAIEGWPHAPNSDFFPTLELDAERTRFSHREAAGFVRLARARFDPLAPFEGRRRGPAENSATPIAGVPRVEGLAFAAALRSEAPPAAASSDRGDPDPEALAAHRNGRWAFALGLASGAPPPDWRAWVRELDSLEAALHAGTAGWADAAFYDAVTAYLDRAGAPAGARHALAFLHGLAAWDFAEAAAAAEALAPLAVGGDVWIPVDRLLEGGVVAELCRGEVRAAERLLGRLAGASGLVRDDLRVRVMAGLLGAASKNHLPRCRSVR